MTENTSTPPANLIERLGPNLEKSSQSGPTGGFSELLKKEAEVSPEGLSESQSDQLTVMGMRADDKINRLEPKTRPAVREGEIKLMIESLTLAQSLIEELKALIDANPFLQSVVHLEVGAGNYSTESGNRFTAEQSQEIVKQVPSQVNKG